MSEIHRHETPHHGVLTSVEHSEEKEEEEEEHKGTTNPLVD